MVAPRVGTIEPLRVELDDFLGRVERGETVSSQEQTAAAIVATVEAAERSLATEGAWIDVAANHGS
jgi:hypothetical protein